jgi:hypothetical protein
MVKFVLALVAVIILGGVVFLATWDMPPPIATTEKVIPNERFQ